jgi:MYXO-CTERM domain-containing protein
VPSGYDAHLFFVNNTVVNDLMSGTFVNNTTSTAALVENDIFFGGGTVDSRGADTLTTNYSGASPRFVDEATLDVHLLAGSPCIDTGTLPGKAGSVSLEPVDEYVQPAGEQPRSVVGKAIDIGAYEFGLPDGGSPEGGGPMTDGGSGSDAAGKPPHDGGRGAKDASSAGDAPGDGAGGASSNGSTGGCGCVTAGRETDSGPLTLAGPALLGLLALRRRRVK